MARARFDGTMRGMEKLCRLQAAIGNDEECPRGWCAFWEGEGRGRGLVAPRVAAVEPGCLLERLGIDFENVDLAYYLNDVRRALDAAASEAAAARARREVAQLVPADLSGS